MKKTSAKDLTSLAEQAFKQAAQKVIDRAEQTGTPVIVWEDGAVKEVQPRQLKTARKGNGKPRKRARGA